MSHSVYRASALLGRGQSALALVLTFGNSLLIYVRSLCVCVSFSARHWDNRPRRPKCAWFAETKHQDATTVWWRVEAAKSSLNEQWKVWNEFIYLIYYWSCLFKGGWESLTHFNPRDHKQIKKGNTSSRLRRDVYAEVKERRIKKHICTFDYT